ncbi:hypothetical protein KDA11_02660 [Candidatus Saccharibacteria bacterium]|nr:hypothetical protein [Candidatus Saccharibacteria bacterium]
MRNIFKQKKTSTTKATQYDPDSLFVPWDYPEPIEEAQVLRFLSDERFLSLMQAAKHGWHTAQKAIVHMSIIHPRFDYKPVIHDEFRENFEALNDNLKTPELVLYEHEDKLIMPNDYEAYWIYRERGLEVANCIIVGKYTECDDIGAYDRPFFIGHDSESSPILDDLMV